MKQENKWDSAREDHRENVGFQLGWAPSIRGFKKVYDSISPVKLWEVLERTKLNFNLNKISQGTGLSRTLFKIYLEQALNG